MRREERERVSHLSLPQMLCNLGKEGRVKTHQTNVKQDNLFDVLFSNF